MKKEQLPSKHSITTKPFPASSKVYVKGELHDIEVAMREIKLEDSKPIFTDGEFVKPENEPITVYDTSGPYTDPTIEIDVHKG